MYSILRTDIAAFTPMHEALSYKQLQDERVLGALALGCARPPDPARLALRADVDGDPLLPLPPPPLPPPPLQICDDAEQQGRGSVT